MKRFIYIPLIFLITFGTNLFSQSGKLLIVGGGSEKNGANSWSTPAYKWAGQGKKVAIVGTSTGSLATYFLQQCGAIRAREFAINSRDSADSQATYDTLVNYDVIFFRGGDQWDYYDLYKNTKLLEAVLFVYNQGGLIGGTSAGMHILSSVVYTAENGTVYPYECIENPNNQYVTLENDFLNLFPGYVFDTHFAERARFGRLVGFLANYQLNQGIDISGLGMDDMTCMTIDENLVGTVYGTGCANIYSAGSSYSQNGNKLLADTVHVIQLLQGCQYDFINGIADFSGLDQQINSALLEEQGNFTVLASGSSILSNSQSMLADLVNGCGTPSADVLILSGNYSLASGYQTKILELGASAVYIFDPTSSLGNDPELANRITSATKILFLKNSYPSFSGFLQTPNGLLLQQKCKSSGMITAFAGEDARFAGKTVVENYLTYGASYYAELTFETGLSLLNHSVIMPDTYLNSDVYENTATAVPYAMVMDSLKYGIWLTNHSTMRYSPVNGETILTGFGTAPVMVIANAGVKAGFSSQTGTGSTSVLPRMVAGFERLHLSLIDDTTPYKMGNLEPSDINEPELNTVATILQNPVDHYLRVEIMENDVKLEIIDLKGLKLYEFETRSGYNQFDISSLNQGIYLVLIRKGSQSQTSMKKIIKL